MQFSNALQERLESVIRNIRQETEFIRHNLAYRNKLKRNILRESTLTIDDLLEELEAITPPFNVE
jgi:hypothetical protein